MGNPDNVYNEKRKAANDAKAIKKNKTGNHYNQGNQSAKKNIDVDEFVRMCEEQCTKAEISNHFHVTDKTIDRFCHETFHNSFSVVFQEKRQGGFASLRHSMYEMAKTNPTMAIWLSKNWLKMSDKPTENETPTVDKDDEFSKSLREIGEKL